MLTIILGIIVTILTCHVAITIADKFRNRSMLVSNLICLLFTIGLITSFCLGILYPFNGYKEWEISHEYSLVPISNNPCIYLSVSNDNTYSYKYIEENIEYDDYIRRTNVIIIPTPDDFQPILLQYYQEAKKSIWTFGQNYNEKYIFFVPEKFIIYE